MRSLRSDCLTVGTDIWKKARVEAPAPIELVKLRATFEPVVASCTPDAVLATAALQPIGSSIAKDLI